MQLLKVVSRTFLCACTLTVAAVPAASANPWKGAELQSRESWVYGAFEARFRSAPGEGMITPFFLLKDGTEYPGASWEEMDFEVFGKDGGRKFQTQLMTPGNPRTQHLIENDSGQDLSADYHTYRLEWTPQHLRFYLDGRLVRDETDNGTYGKLLDSRQTDPMRLRVSLWAQDDSWSGRIDPSKTPAHAYFSYVEASRYTPGKGSHGGDFTPYWRDDFRTFDHGRWTATVSPGSTTGVTDFVSENAAVDDGYLVLSLTDFKHVGMSAAPPRDGHKAGR